MCRPLESLRRDRTRQDHHHTPLNPSKIVFVLGHDIFYPRCLLREGAAHQTLILLGKLFLRMDDRKVERPKTLFPYVKLSGEEGIAILYPKKQPVTQMMMFYVSRT